MFQFENNNRFNKTCNNSSKIAFDNAVKFFDLNKKEENIIKGHMFPFGFPKSKEAWIVSFVDKYIAVFEYSSNFKKMMHKKQPAYQAEQYYGYK